MALIGAWDAWWCWWCHLALLAWLLAVEPQTRGIPRLYCLWPLALRLALLALHARPAPPHWRRCLQRLLAQHGAIAPCSLVALSMLCLNVSGGGGQTAGRECTHGSWNCCRGLGGMPCACLSSVMHGCCAPGMQSALAACWALKSNSKHTDVLMSSPCPYSLVRAIQCALQAAGTFPIQYRLPPRSPPALPPPLHPPHTGARLLAPGPPRRLDVLAAVPAGPCRAPLCCHTSRTSSL